MATSPTHGPDAMLSPELPVTRGQWATLAALAMELLGVELPASRLEASVMAVRLRSSIDNPDPDAPAPRVAEPDPF